MGTLAYGKYLVIDDTQWIDSGAVYIEDGKIVETGRYKYIKEKYTPKKEVGSDRHLLVPGFVNAHGHGKGVTDFQRGHIDDTLETWKFRTYPPVDLYNDTVWTGIKQLEAGVTTTMHNHTILQPSDALAECERVIDAYKACSLKVGFAPTLANRNWFVYGDNEAFMRSLPPYLEELCRKRVEKSRQFDTPQYFATFNDLRKHRSTSDVTIMHGPMSPQWVDTDSLQSIKQNSLETGTNIHMHVQQTQLQYLYGWKAYGKSLIGYLADLGFLGSNVTCGHAVWISEEDIELLVESGTSVTHHPACNLRVRNGISPVYRLLERGVCVGIGMDDKEFGDDKDFIEEMRLVSKLHRLPSHHLDSPHLLPEDAFRMATRYGAQTLGMEKRIGTIEPGKQADIVFIDLERITEPFVCPSHSPIDLLVYRGGTRDVDMVMVDGDIVVKDGKVIHIDRNEVVERLRSALTDDYVITFEEQNRAYSALRLHVARWFESWYSDIDRRDTKPFYHLNGIR